MYDHPLLNIMSLPQREWSEELMNKRNFIFGKMAQTEMVSYFAGCNIRGECTSFIILT